MDGVLLKIDGRDVIVRPTWRAGLEIAERVADPATIAAEMTMLEEFSKQGMTYRPKVELGYANSVQMLAIAARHSGEDLGEDAVGSAYIGRAMEAVNDAARLIALFIAPGPEKPVKE